MGTDRADFKTYIMRQNDEEGMTNVEIKASMSLFMGAGTESTTTVLFGAIYYLPRNPGVLEKVIDEVRGNLKAEDEITQHFGVCLPVGISG